MSAPRTQEHRCWYQVEDAPNGGKRRVIQLDLNMVDYVRAVIGLNPDDASDDNYATDVQITYGGLMKPVIISNGAPFTGPAADLFWKAWCKFVTCYGKQPAAPVGTIYLPESSGQGKFKT